MKVFKKISAFSISLFFAILICFFQTLSQSNQDEKYVDVKIKDGKLIYTVYKSAESKEIDLSDLEIWEQTPKEHPVNMSLSYDPEIQFKVQLLAKGLAKLKDGITYPDELLEAQNKAKQNGVGLWKDITTPQNSPSIQPKPTPEPPFIDLSWVMSKVISIAWYVLPLSGFLGLLTIIYKFIKRRKLFIVFIGLKSAGKSTVCDRLFYPEAKPKKCFSPEANKAPEIHEGNEPVYLKSYEVTQIGIDTAGGNVGEQVTEMLKKNSLIKKLFFKSSKYVWIIVLAPTDNHEVSKNSEDKDKQNDLFIREQLGSLRSEVGLLTGKKKSFLGRSRPLATPDYVMLCINKSDLFLESQNDEVGKKKLEELFKSHIAFIKDACAGKSKFNFRVVSACEGWDVHLVKRDIERGLF
jgi:GTPase SAR1 family protein